MFVLYIILHLPIVFVYIVHFEKKNGDVDYVLNFVTYSIFRFSCGISVTYFSIKHSLWMVALTYGTLTNFGSSIAYGPPAQTAVKVSPIATYICTVPTSKRLPMVPIEHLTYKLDTVVSISKLGEKMTMKSRYA